MDQAFNLPVYNCEGKEVEKLELNREVFDGKENLACVYQVVNGYLANQRQGLAATKTRGEVSGGGKKPWKQKGTGRARVGSTRSPLWRHGGVIFGPHPRDFSYKVPQKIKNLALKSSLNSKLKEESIIVLDELKLETSKTKEAAKIFTHFKMLLGRNKKPLSSLLLVENMDKNLKLALSNIDFLKLNLAKDTFAYEVLQNRKLILTKGALEEITKRLS
ncbi:MAG: 50S ribosomal protein L4 [Candidatus Omnitrophota bacterium]